MDRVDRFGFKLQQPRRLGFPSICCIVVRIPEGAPKGIHPEPHTLVEELFISMFRFEHRGKFANSSPTESDWFGMFPLIGQANGEKVRTYIPVKAACKLSGYNKQYLRRLLRQEKLGGIKVGQVWLIEILSLENHLSLGNQGQDRRYGPQIGKKRNSIKYLD